MKLMVNHQTHYHYSEVARNSIQYIKMIPQSSLHQLVHYWDISVPGERIMKRDAFDNLWITSSQRFDYQNLTIMAQGIVELNLQNSGCHDSVVLPHVFLQPTPATLCDAEMLNFALEIVKTKDVSSLINLSQKILERITYSPYSTNVQTTAIDAFYAAQGVCQDHAHVMIAMCRALNLPARYVSGYLYDYNSPHLASHAWAEVYVDHEWHCFDVSNQIFVPKTHIYVAIGRDYFDVAPIRGIRENGGIEEMISTVQVLAC